jgi:hypothetical protein
MWRWSSGCLVTSNFVGPRTGHAGCGQMSKEGGIARRVSIVVQPADLPTNLCRDPTDVPVLGTAVAGECTLLISVDRDLLDRQTIQAIPIIRPGEYWRRIDEID